MMALAHIIWVLLIVFSLAVSLAYSQKNLIRMEMYTAGIFVVSVLATLIFAFWLASVISGALLAFFLLFNHIPSLRQMIAMKAYKEMQKSTPRISQTEEDAIAAGDLSWEKFLFVGDYAAALNEARRMPRRELSPAEKKFLAEETEALCALCSNTEIEKHKGLPPAALTYIKKRKFWGMIIPKSLGGLGFSATAHAAVVAKLASRSAALAIMVMVPNSLGPGELLIRYGTAAQKKKYLAKLAIGEEIPCFALTSLPGGSDAGAMEDHGVLCKKVLNDKEVLGFRLKLKKRYITLAPLATLVGVAFKAYDPQGLLRQSKVPSTAEEDGYLGFTCALLSHRSKGLQIGRRHNPLGILFHNGPIEGDDVFVPLDEVIGGAKGVGKGWRMLMECLAAGRGISLPSLSQSSTCMSLLTSSFYTNIRRQFGIRLAEFEGIAEKLTQLALNAAATETMRCAVTDMIDAKQKPALASALIKYYSTEMGRESVNIAMDLHGGKAIMLGERNYLEEMYRSAPIGITVEGANILTRCMIIFGQGIMRCHPFLRGEAKALTANKSAAFTDLFFLHLTHILHLGATALASAWSFGWLPHKIIQRDRPKDGLEVFHRRLTNLSAAFAILTEISLIKFGGNIKRKESLSGRFADVWCALFVATATMAKYEKDGMPADQLPLVRLLLAQMTRRAREGLEEIMTNLFFLPRIWKLLFLSLGRYPVSQDKRVHSLASSLGRAGVKLLESPSNLLFHAPRSHLENLRNAYILAQECQPIMRRVRKQQGAKPANIALDDYLTSLVKSKMITDAEYKLWQKAEDAAEKLLAVDDFSEIK